jgi:ATP-dependent DNA helicase DinG
MENFLSAEIPPRVALQHFFKRLAKQHAKYEARIGQKQLAIAVQTAIRERRRLVGEAATGTGKSLAYLIPVVLNGKQAIISTRTKILQSQLLDKDIPKLQAISPKPITAVTLKGRANYVCLLNYEQWKDEREDRPKTRKLHESIDQWIESEQSTDGVAEIAESGLQIPPTLTDELTIDSQNCWGSECPFKNQCFANRAFNRAQKADIVITNHALTLIDARIRYDSNNVASILPPAPVLVLDEAHTVESAATTAFSSIVGLGRWKYLSRQFYSLIRKNKDLIDLADKISVQKALDKAINRATALYVGWNQELAGRTYMPVPPVAQELIPLTVAVADALTPVVKTLERGAENSSEENPRYLKPWKLLVSAALSLLIDVQRATSPSDGECIQLVAQTSPDTVVLKAVPLSVAEYLQQTVWSYYSSVIATSATLRTGRTFEFWQEQTGCPETADTLMIDSPFDYSTRSCLYLPPDPETLDPTNRSPYYEAALQHQLMTLLRASQGRALILCTSHAAVKQISGYLRQQRVPWQVLAQGDRLDRELIQAFKDDTSSVLVGTAKFWEGIDIPGDSLSLLIIDKLPFHPPDDPIFSARLRAYEQRVGQWKAFQHFTLPQMTLLLRQGVGRLIRSASDRGVIALLDGRLITKKYSNSILDSLPPSPVTCDASDVVDFFSRKEVA